MVYRQKKNILLLVRHFFIMSYSIRKSTGVAMPDNMTCRQKIMSNDYKDFMVNVGESSLLGVINQSRTCIQHVWGEYRVISVEDNSDTRYMATLGFQTIPKLYTITDSTNMDVSGITKLRNQPYLGLDGNGVMVGLIDTGECVIIMLRSNEELVFYYEFSCECVF